MTSSYVGSLMPRIRRILESADLSTISAKAVRKELIADGEDATEVKAHREALDKEIGKVYEELVAANEAASPTPSSEDVPLTARSVATPQSSLPQPLHRVKNEVKSKIKTEAKPRVPTGRETDEEMARRLQEEFDAMTAASGRASRSAGSSRPKKSKPSSRKRSKATVDDSDQEGEGRVKKKRAPNPNSAFNKELILSDALAAFTGEERLSRPQTVKRLWNHIKDNNLQDPSDKRMILCDDAMREVFHVDKLHMFTMNKLLGVHFRDPDDIIYKEEKPTQAEANGVIHPTARAPAPISAPAVVEDSEDSDNDEKDFDEQSSDY